jgi:methylated-DNA-[protein]-cysteine S-methyltransferase
MRAAASACKRAVPKEVALTYSIFETAWGAFGFVARGRRLVATYLPGRRADIRRAIQARWPEAIEAADSLPSFRRQVLDYFAGKTRRFNVDIDLSEVPPFRQAALRACRRIPYGKMASYRDVARAAGAPGAARAVGGAMANNPLPLVIPCHRVVRSDGSLGGFGSAHGVKDKKRLLRLEKAIPD